MDLLLLVMVLIWGANYSVVKRTFDQISPQAFNALRVTCASVVFLALIRWTARRARSGDIPFSGVFYTPEPLTRRDRWNLIWVGLVGHLLYQSVFIAGLARTSASNAALILGTTPVLVAVMSSVLGLERIGRVHWIGAGISVLGLYLVVSADPDVTPANVSGDLMIGVAVTCWAIYTIGSGRLMARHSPLYVTGMTMAYGGLPYAALMLPQVAGVNWSGISVWVWGVVVGSALLALCLSYLIWYTAVKRIGPSRTSMYSNLVPIAAMIVATTWLHEPLSAAKILGAAGVLGGVALTRLGRSSAVPIEE
jgi:drug/metabolite transporter (DMT)-like permease